MLNIVINIIIRKNVLRYITRIYYLHIRFRSSEFYNF